MEYWIIGMFYGFDSIDYAIQQAIRHVHDQMFFFRGTFSNINYIPTRFLDFFFLINPLNKK